MTDRTDVNAEPRQSYARRNLIPIVVILVFAVLGFVTAPLVAPDIPFWRAGLAGTMLGAFGGFSTVLNRLLE